MKATWILFAALMTAAANADEATVAPCADLTEPKSKSRQFFEGKILMTNLLALEAKGEAKFHPAFAQPAQQCLFGKFDVAGTGVDAIHSKFEPGEATLLFRFATAGSDARNIFVIYDGMASFMSKKTVFFIVEERAGAISYYAMFREQPTFAALKPLITGIVEGSAKPLARVRWPAGAKEPEIDAYDTSRLK